MSGRRGGSFLRGRRHVGGNAAITPLRQTLGRWRRRANDHDRRAPGQLALRTSSRRRVLPTSSTSVRRTRHFRARRVLRLRYASTPPIDFLKGTSSTMLPRTSCSSTVATMTATGARRNSPDSFERVAPSRTYRSDNYSTFLSVGNDGDFFGKDYIWEYGELSTPVGSTAPWPLDVQGRRRCGDATMGWITSSSETAGRTTFSSTTASAA